jgi:hypothetical protein
MGGLDAVTEPGTGLQAYGVFIGLFALILNQVMSRE